MSKLLSRQQLVSCWLQVVAKTNRNCDFGFFVLSIGIEAVGSVTRRTTAE